MSILKTALPIIIKLIIGGTLIGCVIVAATATTVQLTTKDQILTPASENQASATAALVLGCGVRPDGTPTPMLQERIDKGVELYHKGIVSRIIMSGDHGQVEYDEVNLMKAKAIEAGVPSEAIFMDHAGFSTYDSVYRAQYIFQAPSLIIVSQKYHLPRALYIAHKLGIEAQGAYPDVPNHSGQLIRDAREILAQAKDFAKAQFHPEPTFLGPQIPITGNGDVTND